MSATNGHAERCDTCRFWTRVQDGMPMGHCRERPPTVILLGMQQHPVTGRGHPVTDTFWPMTPEHEVCGARKAPRDAFVAIDLSKLKDLP
jgi:hypothetical protein